MQIDVMEVSVVVVGVSLYHHVMILFMFVYNVNRHLFVIVVGNNDSVIDTSNVDVEYKEAQHSAEVVAIVEDDAIAVYHEKGRKCGDMLSKVYSQDNIEKEGRK